MSRIESEDVDRVLDQDLKALGRASLKNLPYPLTVRLPAGERRPYMQEILQMSIRTFQARPWLATAAGVVFMALVMLIIPISYTRTSGYEVRLDLPAGIDRGFAERVATEFGRTLEAGQAPVITETEAGFSLVASVSGRAEDDLRKEALSFARLSGGGSVQVTPIRETLSTNLLAYATGRILEIRVSSEGRTEAEIEADIRSQLEAAGIQNPSVTVERDGDQTQLTIRADKEEGSNQFDQMQVTFEGSDPSNQTEVRIHSVTKMSDAEIKAEIERQLREKGVDAVVTVTNGKISIDRRN